MAKTPPFHSPDSSHYHDNDECWVGREIESDKIYEKPQKQHCPMCKALSASEQPRLGKAAGRGDL